MGQIISCFKCLCCFETDYEKKKKVLQNRIDVLKKFKRRVDTAAMNSETKKKEKAAFEKQRSQSSSSGSSSTSDVESNSSSSSFSSTGGGDSGSNGSHQEAKKIASASFDLAYDAATDAALQAARKSSTRAISMAAEVVIDFADIIDVSEFIPFVGNLKAIVGIAMAFFYFFVSLIEFYIMLVFFPCMFASSLFTCLCCCKNQGLFGICYILQHAINTFALLFLNIALVFCYMLSPCGSLLAMSLVSLVSCSCGSAVKPSTKLGTTILVAIPHSSTLPRLFLCCYSSSYDRNIRNYEKQIEDCNKKIEIQKAKKMEKKMRSTRKSTAQGVELAAIDSSSPTAVGDVNKVQDFSVTHADGTHV
jgi:hypothetical protein